MNTFDLGSMLVHGGFIAFYRMVHHPKNFIPRSGKHDIIFATAGEVHAAAGEAFKEYLNGPIVSESLTGPATKKPAALGGLNGLFGKGRATEVERIGERERERA
ncbi:hypothetical protein [Neorhizobium sp. DT-125]|uniref:hypothetical protein n=1 Tax=Neorhizobium sp. DT-125 TaxID=3396163 RepID=UPI003F1BD6A7